MLGLNNVQIIGNLGGTPEMKFLNSNDHVVNFSVAVNERWKNRDGEPQERTTWLRIVASTALVPRALSTLSAATPYSSRAAFKFVNTRTRTTSNELRSKSSHRRSAFLAAGAAPAMKSGRRRGNRDDTRENAQRPRPTLTRLGMITLSKNRSERLAVGRRRSQ